MKGMSLEQFTEVTQFVQKYHKFGRWSREIELAAIKDGVSPEVAEYGYNIKYVRCDYDTRFGDVWGVTFDRVRFARNYPYIESKLPKDWKYDNIYDLSMAYLKGEFKPSKEFYIE
jgi:hypothetical protein